jgi:hypothetical protein
VKIKSIVFQNVYGIFDSASYAVVSIKVRSVMEQIIYTLFNVSTLMRKGDPKSIVGNTIFNICFVIVVVGFIWLRESGVLSKNHRAVFEVADTLLT